MRDLLPDGEDYRRAIKWVSGQLQDHPGEPIQQFVHQAILKFDLSPRDAESLLFFFAKHKKEAQEGPKE